MYIYLSVYLAYTQRYIFDFSAIFVIRFEFSKVSDMLATLFLTLFTLFYASLS